VASSRFRPRAFTVVQSSWDNQQQYSNENQGYQQYFNGDEASQQYLEADQGYEQYYEQYSSANQGLHEQGSYSQEQQGYAQYPSQEQGYQQSYGQAQGYQQYVDGNQYQGYDNTGYQQGQYYQQDQYGATQTTGQSQTFDQQGAGNQGLILNGLDREMSKMASKFSFTESDYLAAARRRAELKVESSNSVATDEEWFQVANEKKQQFGAIDDWENSAKEAGNADSQILMFTEPPPGGEDDNEPKLLLF